MSLIHISYGPLTQKCPGDPGHNPEDTVATFFIGTNFPKHSRYFPPIFFSKYSDELAAMPAPWRDRVQHHARRFHEKDATTVLNRYEQQRRIMSRPQLEKHAFHVACWLVLPEVRRSHGDSVEALLSRYLESLDGQPVCERLKAVLSLVSASSGVAGLSGSLGEGQKRKAEMMQADELEKPDSSKPVEISGIFWKNCLE